MSGPRNAHSTARSRELIRSCMTKHFTHVTPDALELMRTYIELALLRPLITGIARLVRRVRQVRLTRSHRGMHIDLMLVGGR